MRDLLRTSRTYASRENAVKALERALIRGGFFVDDRIPYVIAVNEEGRFAPVVVGADFLPLVFQGVTVVS